ncbi:MAG TPA: hypothetical protein VNJ04_14625 [Gemmatimonadaceae bacterium]|nr:hypothetical protein [Gemmatimonadaceae bacterium]
MQLKHLLVGRSVALVACGGDTTAPKNLPTSGSLSFSFSGGTPGSYSATGLPPANGTGALGPSPWAAGVRDDARQAIQVVGSVPKTSTTWDLAVVQIARLTVGSNTINSSCTGALCTGVSVAFESNQASNSFTLVYLLTTGTATISSVSSTRPIGRFSGSGSCISMTGTSSAFTVTGGTFDVPLFADKA